MLTIAIAVVVIITLAIIYALSSGFRERFERNFIFTGTAAGIMIGEILIIWGYIWFADTGAALSDALTFSTSGEADFSFGMFAIGSISFLLAWFINIRKSSFIWGMIQNILQTIIVTVFSVFIVAGALLYANAKKSD